MLTGFGGLARAALPSVPGVNLLPGVRKTGADPDGISRSREAIRIDERHVADYAQLCGFARKDAVPVSYPHLLTFPLQLSILADPAFPFAAMGSVHVENVITAHRPIQATETLAVAVRSGPVRPHPKGRLVDFESTMSVGDEVVWESVSTYLRRGGGTPDASPGLAFDAAPDGGIDWRMPADLGRRYAAVSGDHNPIHLYPLTAKALGFPRQIAHGMCSLARCIAAVENRLPDAVRIEAAWKRPILLPGHVRFWTGLSSPTEYAADPERTDFALSDPATGAPHLLGRASPA